MLVEIHMIQNHAPSNLNRDDTGSPKDCLFGEALRARISSQCVKRSIRRSELFASELAEHLAVRTRRLPQEVKKALLERGSTQDEAELVALKVSGLGSGKESDALETRQLVFLDPAEVSTLASQAKRLLDRLGADQFRLLKTEDFEKELAGVLPRSVDIALFGRMTTSAFFEDVQASIQVAHPFSTHRVEKQFDYFTAVDDLVEEADEVGAGMIGDVEFNSATYYKYFSLHWEGFVRNLGGTDESAETAATALKAFLQAAALTTPTGKQNSFAAHNPPDAVLVEVKERNVPISYANAFVKPVHPGRDEDVVQASIAALGTYRKQVNAAYGIVPLKSAYLTVRGEEIPGAERVANLMELGEVVVGALADGKGSRR